MSSSPSSSGGVEGEEEDQTYSEPVLMSATEGQEQESAQEQKKGQQEEEHLEPIFTSSYPPANPSPFNATRIPESRLKPSRTKTTTTIPSSMNIPAGRQERNDMEPMIETSTSTTTSIEAETVPEHLGASKTALDTKIALLSSTSLTSPPSPPTAPAPAEAAEAEAAAPAEAAAAAIPTTPPRRSSSPSPSPISSSSFQFESRDAASSLAFATTPTPTPPPGKGGSGRGESAGSGSGQATDKEKGKGEGKGEGKGRDQMTGGDDSVILGVVLVDFNHLVGPSVEWSYPSALTEAFAHDDELARLLPFLALPDGAHLKEEDYCYFHCVYNPPVSAQTSSSSSFPANQTLFGISCNRQIPSSSLHTRSPDVTRSTVQKALVVLASRPVFGPIRDKLGLVTRALFAQRDFSEKTLLTELYTSLEAGLQGKADEGSMYIGTSLRELLYTFRHRTLVLVKMMMLQKRILLFGYPVETLCTFQYSLISLMPGLLMNVADCGHPDLDFRSDPPRKASTLKTSDRNSLLRYMGLPLHTFGKGSFFQPYLPLQQIEMLRSPSWLVGTTNSIVTQQRDCQWDLLVNIEQTSFQFSDPKLERMVALTPSDRLWMDQVIKAVEDTWNPADPTRPSSMSFRGSDDDLRSRFEEYICSSLAALKYQDFAASGQNGPIMPGEIRFSVEEPFGEPWLEAFRKTRAYQSWNDSTDEMLFDICEPRHPCEGKTNAVSDIGIRLAEGLYDLKLDQQIATGREAIGSALSNGSTTLFNAFNGVRNEVASRLKERERNRSPTNTNINANDSPNITPTVSAPSSSMPDIRSAIGGFGSYFNSKIASFQNSTQAPVLPPTPTSNRSTRLRPLNLRGSPSKATATMDNNSDMKPHSAL